MNLLNDYMNFEENVYIPKSNKDFKKKYNNLKKIKVNVFGKSYRFLSIVECTNLLNKGVGNIIKFNKRL